MQDVPEREETARERPPGASGRRPTADDWSIARVAPGRRRPEGERSEAERRWGPFLAQVSAALADSIDYEETFRQVLALSVRHLADWCMVFLRHGDEERLEVAHRDPRRLDDVRALCALPARSSPESPLVQAVRSGEPRLLADVDADALARIATRDEQHAALRRLAPASAIAVPLIARGRVTGGVLLVSDDPAERYGPDDLALAVEFGRRAGLAVDNAYLHHEVKVELTERRRAERELAERLADLRATLESTADGILVVSAMGEVTTYNQRFLELWRIPAELAAARDDRRLLAHVRDQVVDPAAFEARVAELYADPEAESRDFVHLVDGRVLARYSRPRRSEGRTTGRVWSFHDVTDRERAMTEQCFLAEAGSVLASSLDHERTMQTIARLMVPLLGDWCQVGVVEADGKIHHLAIAHADPAREERMRELQRRFPIALHPAYPSVGVVESGRPWLAEETPDEMLQALAEGDAQLLRTLRELAPATFLCVPMIARGTTLGAILLAREPGGRAFGRDDLRLAEEVAARAALAVDNARLYADVIVANQAKADFLAVMSHELRTPLTTIMGYTELLADGVTGEVSDAQAQQLGRIQLSAQHLLQLIEEILSYARIEAGREQVHAELVDLAQLARESALLVEPAVRGKALDFVLRLPAGPLPIRTDAGKVRQILVNLLSNAVKFTHQGEIGLAIRATEHGYRLVVWDTGIGIAREHLEHIFDPFWQVEEAHTRRVGGTGLGLSVTRRLARMLGGEVEVESAPGEGTRFTVMLAK